MQEYYSALKSPYFRPVSVEKAAAYFRVSTRRIRKLLADGRLVGVKNGKAWQVFYPYQYTIGMRGPHLAFRQALGVNTRPYNPKRKRNA